MLDESSLELDSFLWFDLSFFLGVLALLFLCGFWTLHSFFFWVLGLTSRCFFFWRFGQSRFTGLFFLWQSRVANRSLSIGNERERLGT